MERYACHPEDHPRIGRRELLRVGGLGLFGTSLADLLRLEAQACGPPARRRARSVVFIFQSGGPSQHETFDPKPEAPEEVRGEYGVTRTKIRGVLFCESLPRLAARADRFAVVRTMHHVAGREFRNEHNSCAYLLHTGTTALPAGDTNASIAQPRAGRIAWPSIGSLVAYAAPPHPGGGLPALIEPPPRNHKGYPRRRPGPPPPK